MFLKIAALVSRCPGKTFAAEEKRFEKFPKTSKYILSPQEALHGMHVQTWKHNGDNVSADKWTILMICQKRTL